MNETEKFLADLNSNQKENDDIFNSGADPFKKEDLEDKQGDDDKGSDEKQPFHKDPKVQKYIDKQVQKALSNFKPQQAEPIAQKNNDEEDKITDVFTRLVGNDTPEKIAIVKELKTIFKEVGAKGATEAYEKLQSERQAEIEADSKAAEMLTEGFESIEEEFGVDLTSNTPQARKTKSTFVDFIKRVAPKNSEGEVTEFPDFIETFKIFQETQKDSKQPNNRAKELANRSMNNSSNSDNQPVTRKTWKDIDRMFDNIK